MALVSEDQLSVSVVPACRRGKTEKSLLFSRPYSTAHKEPFYFMLGGQGMFRTSKKSKPIFFKIQWQVTRHLKVRTASPENLKHGLVEDSDLKLC